MNIYELFGAEVVVEFEGVEVVVDTEILDLGKEFLGLIIVNRSLICDVAACCANCCSLSC